MLYFGSALILNIHLHMIVLDGVYTAGVLDSTRSYLNTTRRVYFYVIVKMWFKLPIYRLVVSV